MMFHDLLHGGQGFGIHWLAANMAEPTRTWPNFGTIPAPQPNPYTQIDAHQQPTERDLAVQRAIHILSQR